MNIDSIMHGRENTEAVEKIKGVLVHSLTILLQYYLFEHEHIEVGLDSFENEPLEDQDVDEQRAELGKRYGSTDEMEELFMDEYDAIAADQDRTLTKAANRELGGSFQFDEDEIFDFIYDYQSEVTSRVARKIRDACKKRGIEFAYIPSDLILKED